eukprot:CAMPEP_0206218612 /NCGR_PEP_ID=MMETSP0047_2-20121206/3890_1 /ASSEMBLY_ACC=CAM_ASM_000192 /TAXON_ID=195065 /ORGANISM="Chroomonas mesostigmatica_cf, Strain CCMP1168" /LENGTH=98 /DNA_ID=CAMNT_0053641123 /DNA_START=651 /DNA_END=947 /DNA_ORIENTATION=-
MIIPRKTEHPPKRARASHISMLHRIIRPVQPRPLPIPDPKHTIKLPIRRHPRLLRAPHRGGGDLLIEARHELHVGALKELFRLPQVLIVCPEGGSTVA